MKTIDEIMIEFHDLAIYLPEKEKAKALDVFCEAYQEHKKEHGSFRLLCNLQYSIKMNERQEYQINRVKEYIEGLQSNHECTTPCNTCRCKG